MNIELVEKAFIDYVNTFDMTNENIALKYEHTFEVVKYSEIIAKKLNLSEEEINLAKTIAFLHDIGRFEQVIKTNTFRDNEMDHAENGVDLLFNRSLIDKFQIDKKYHEVIRKAVRNHNKLQIEDEYNQEEEKFIKIIRDADKIDIYRVRVKYLNNDFKDRPQESKIDLFYRKKSIPIKDNKTKSDAIICVISFIFDIYYKETIETLKESHYYQDFMNAIKPDDSQLELFNDIKNKVYEYLGIEGE